MRTQSLVIFALAVGLLSGIVINEDIISTTMNPHEGQIVARHDPASLDRTADYSFDHSHTYNGKSSARWSRKKIRPWNHSRNHIKDHIEACTAFHSLAWLAWSVLQPAKSITHESGETIFRPAERQDGPLVVTMRVLQLWWKMLMKLEYWFIFMDDWTTDAQVRVAHCYMDYSLQTSILLKTLEEQAESFAINDPIRDLMHIKIKYLAHTYARVGRALYVDYWNWDRWAAITKVRRNEFLNGSWPDPMPDWFVTQFPMPVASHGSIREWVLQLDAPVSPSQRLFIKTMNQWSKKPPLRSEPPKDPREKDKKARRKRPKKKRPKKPTQNPDKAPKNETDWEFNWDRGEWWKNGTRCGLEGAPGESKGPKICQRQTS